MSHKSNYLLIHSLWPSTSILVLCSEGMHVSDESWGGIA
jgi:hypothetical protein